MVYLVTVSKVTLDWQDCTWVHLLPVAGHFKELFTRDVWAHRPFVSILSVIQQHEFPNIVV